MKYYRSFFLSLIMLIAINSAHGQKYFVPGYVISKDNDTVEGLIDFRVDKLNSARCLFKYSQESPVKEFKPFEIKAYRLIDNGKYYISKVIPLDDEEKAIFIEYLVNGIYDLYFYNDHAKNRYYIERPDGSIYELKNEEEIVNHENKNYVHHTNEHIGLLRYLFAEDPETYKDVETINLSHKSLIQVTTQFHNNVCFDEECIIYEKNVSPLKISIAPFFSYNLTSTSLKPDYSLSVLEFDNTYFPSFGMIIKMLLPNSNERLGIKTITDISKTINNGSVVRGWNSDIYRSPVRLQSTNIRQVFGMEYAYPGLSIKPSLFLGVGFHLPLKRDVNIAYSNYTRSYILLEEDFLRSSLVVAGGIGINYAYKKVILFSNLNYYYDYKPIYRLSYKIHTLSLSTGLYF